MITVKIEESRGLSNTKYHKLGKPNWWVAYTIKGSTGLTFCKISSIRADQPLSVSIEVPEHAEKVIVGMKGQGKVSEYDVDEFRTKDDNLGN